MACLSRLYGEWGCSMRRLPGPAGAQPAAAYAQVQAHTLCTAYAQAQRGHNLEAA